MMSRIFPLNCKANAANLKWNSVLIRSIRQESVKPLFTIIGVDEIPLSSFPNRMQQCHDFVLIISETEEVTTTKETQALNPSTSTQSLSTHTVETITATTAKTAIKSTTTTTNTYTTTTSTLTTKPNGIQTTTEKCQGDHCKKKLTSGCNLQICDIILLCLVMISIFGVMEM